MRIAYFDCPMGISGDMILGALVHAGLEVGRLEEALAGLKLPGYGLRCEPVLKGVLSATQVAVEVSDSGMERRLAEVESLLDAADLPTDVRHGAKAVFRRLAEVEAEIHGTTPDQIHFHELGAIDTLVDVVGAVWGLKRLGAVATRATTVAGAGYAGVVAGGAAGAGPD
jgi:uncharacterized protein (DUF111 family)